MLGASIGITTDRWRFMKTVGTIGASMWDGTNTLGDDVVRHSASTIARFR